MAGASYFSTIDGEVSASIPGLPQKTLFVPHTFFFVTHIHLPEGAGYPWDEPIACLLELCQRHGCIAAGAVLEEGKDSYR